MHKESFREIAPRYDLLNDVISWGLHRRWKRELVREVEKASSSAIDQVLDVSTGTGDVAAIWSQKAGKVVALDPSREMLDVGRHKREGKIDWIQATSEQLPLPSQAIDAITCTFGVRNFTDRKGAFSEWRRVLRPGGVAGILEIHPVPATWYKPGVDLYWERVVPQLGRLLSRKDAYEYLRDSARSFLSRGELIKEVDSAGFRTSLARSMMAGGMVSLTTFVKYGG